MRKNKNFLESKESIRLKEQCIEFGINDLIWNNHSITQIRKLRNKNKKK